MQICPNIPSLNGQSWNTEQQSPIPVAAISIFATSASLRAFLAFTTSFVGLLRFRPRFPLAAALSLAASFCRTLRFRHFKILEAHYDV
jgi:hypothetical protein